MASRLVAAWLAILATHLPQATTALQNGVGHAPVLGWSTWLTFKYDLNATLVQSSADFLASSPLGAAGYTYILLDDGWPACPEKDSDGHCLSLPPRDPGTQRIPVDPVKFPQGLRAVTDYVHG
eukprot:TRINITY_DN60331_c0_g1_i1.p2 TRINITY_DN60331_c0_g1~~TRINITY_DN60331_c0_g1_i1.p2  ORF type:complete len:123 (+),score=18.82 TRINITY_DN60331_c0_g1_i1:165-533(+)